MSFFWDVTPCVLVCVSVSEGLAASIFGIVIGCVEDRGSQFFPDDNGS